MSAKIISIQGAILFIALFISGCTPAGPRALLNGKKYLDHGANAEAVEQFKTATTLLATNAQAWNYYGVALQRAGQPEDAAAAYQTALKLDRDLVEAHFNLGCLWLEQNKADAAKTEFTAFTQFRPNEPAGWLKLGATQLKLDEIVPAERSFSTVLALKANSEAEAYNGLGLARILRSKPHDAAQFFAAAIQSRADFAPALLNLATVKQQYLHDNKAALENYRAYLALTPRPANWDEVNSLAAGLEQIQAAAPSVSTTVVAKVSAPAPEPKPQPKASNGVVSHPAVLSKPQPMAMVHHVATTNSSTTRPASPAPVKVVTAHPPSQITVPPPAMVVAAEPAVEMPVPEKKTGFWHRLFGSDKSASAAQPEYLDKGLTPLPSGDEPAPHATARPVDVPPAVVSFARYSYLSPGKPAAGDRRSASGAFTKARVFEQAEKWVDALEWYQTAVQIDPAWFEAQYNTGVLAHRLRNYPLALPSYETALAIQPDSVDARYNFALALKASGYVTDAADEFKKILAANPDDARSHLALANLCAQSLHDTAQARQHYLKVLELDPNGSQAADIRFWISANPK